MTDELTEINRRVNHLEYVPSEEAAMTTDYEKCIAFVKNVRELTLKYENDLRSSARVNQLEYLPGEEAAMTSILWRDPSELKPGQDGHVLLKAIVYYPYGKLQAYLVASPEPTLKGGCSPTGTLGFGLKPTVDSYLSSENIRIIAWTPLPKLEG